MSLTLNSIVVMQAQYKHCIYTKKYSSIIVEKNKLIIFLTNTQRLLNASIAGSWKMHKDPKRQT